MAPVSYFKKIHPRLFQCGMQAMRTAPAMLMPFTFTHHGGWCNSLLKPRLWWLSFHVCSVLGLFNGEWALWQVIPFVDMSCVSFLDSSGGQAAWRSSGSGPSYSTNHFTAVLSGGWTYHTDACLDTSGGCAVKHLLLKQNSCSQGNAGQMTTTFPLWVFWSIDSTWQRLARVELYTLLLLLLWGW